MRENCLRSQGEVLKILGFQEELADCQFGKLSCIEALLCNLSCYWDLQLKEH